MQRGELTLNRHAGRGERLARAIKRLENYFQSGEKGLWEHQHSALSSVWSFLGESVRKVEQGESASGAIVMPTGAGKTAIAAELTRALGLRTLILAPTVTIAMQHIEELRERAPEVVSSLYCAHEKSLDGQAIVTTYQSAVPLFEQGMLPDDIDLVFYDEAHRSISPKRMGLHGSLGLVDIGLTASPSYNASRHIWNAFDTKIFEMGIVEAVELGVLSPLRAFVVETEIDVTRVRLKLGTTSFQDLNVALAERHLNVLGRNKAARDFYLDGFRTVPAVAFCITKTHAENFANYLASSGVSAAYVHSGLTNIERERRLRMFEDGTIDVITTRDVLVEGWDSKRVIVELNLRPTYSRVVKTHMVGRVARARPGKEAGIVVEFQDRYREGQQPVQVHHVLEQIQYRQGGLVAAPRKKTLKEESDLRMKVDVKVGGNYLVSIDVKETVSIKPTGADLRDTEILRAILASQPGVDFLTLPVTAFLKMQFRHPDFHGSGISLIHRVFGVPHRPGTILRNEEDYQNFLNYVYEDGVPERAEAAPVHAAPLQHGGEEEVHEEIGRQRALRLMARLIENMEPQKREILALRFGLFDGIEHTWDEIGDKCGMSMGAAQNQGKKALREIRWMLDAAKNAPAWMLEEPQMIFHEKGDALPPGKRARLLSNWCLLKCIVLCSGGNLDGDEGSLLTHMSRARNSGSIAGREDAVAGLREAARDEKLPLSARIAAGTTATEVGYLLKKDNRFFEAILRDKRSPLEVRGAAADVLLQKNGQKYFYELWEAKLDNEVRAIFAKRLVDMPSKPSSNYIDWLLNQIEFSSNLPVDVRIKARLVWNARNRHE